MSLFVEGDDDVPFWTEAVKPYQSKYDIRVATNKMVNPEDGNGKAMLLTMSGLGPSKVVAVDADYDLLIDDYSPYTEDVRYGEYVVNTTWYSVENILMQKTHSIPLLESFSESSKGWFVDYLQKVSDGSYGAPAIKFGEIFTELNIQKLAASGDFSSLADVRFEADSTNVESIEAKLSELNCDGYSLWKAMRGHNLWNSIVKPIEERLLNAQIKEITDQQIAVGKPFNRNAAMNQFGIFTSVKDHLQVGFYTTNLDRVSVPVETRTKLNTFFHSKTS